MTIRINHTPVDFTLEHEATLADLAGSLGAWAASQNWAVVSLLANGKAFALDDPTPLVEVTDVEMEAVPAEDRDREALKVVAEFFGALSQGKKGGYGTFQVEYATLRPLLKDVLGPVLGRLAEALAILDGPWEDQVPRAAQLIAAEARNLAEDQSNPVDRIRKSLEALEATVASLADLGTLFQTGQDREGFGRIVSLLEVLDALGRQATRYFSTHPDEEGPWKTLHGELQPYLLEAEAALKAKDYVLLTDLFEYELGPRLAELRTGFTKTGILDPASGVL